MSKTIKNVEHHQTVMSNAQKCEGALSYKSHVTEPLFYFFMINTQSQSFDPGANSLSVHFVPIMMAFKALSSG